MKRVLVTSANGFVGKQLGVTLSVAGYMTRGSVRNKNDRIQGLNGYSELSVVDDIGPNTAWVEALKDVESVVHLAARVHVLREASCTPLLEFRRVNVLGTERLAKEAARLGIRRLIFVSSVKVNGDATATEPFRENDQPRPEGCYAVSKWEAECTLRSIAVQTGMEIVIVRPPLVYGPGVRANFLRLMTLIDRGIPLPIPPAKNRRSLIGLENLTLFLTRCVDHPGAANETFLISDGEDVSTRELVMRLAEGLERKARFLPISELCIRLAARLIGKEAAANRILKPLLVDAAKARQTLGWNPPVTLDSGLAATTRWYRNHRDSRC
jgi:nucleoside-diphosphate-sugar epimerase